MLNDQILQSFSTSEGFTLLLVGSGLLWLGVVVLSFGVSVGGVFVSDLCVLSEFGGGHCDDRDLFQRLHELEKRPRLH
jgi:hypothetical protein